MGSMIRIKRIRGWLFGGAFAVSIAFNTVQGLRILRLEDELNSRGALAEGTLLPPLLGEDLAAGQRQTINYNDSQTPTLLYVFQPSCVWCQYNSGNINSLAERLEGKCRVIGVSLSSDGLKEFVESHHITFPVYTNIPSPLAEVYKLGATPETIVISRDRKVLKNWKGAYDEPVRSLIEQFFSVRLPVQSS